MISKQLHLKGMKLLVEMTKFERKPTFDIYRLNHFFYPLNLSCYKMMMHFFYSNRFYSDFFQFGYALGLNESTYKESSQVPKEDQDRMIQQKLYNCNKTQCNVENRNRVTIIAT